MKIGVDESGPLLIIFAENENDCACKIDDYMCDEINEIDDTSYSQVWGDVCREIFGSRMFNRKWFTVANYTIFYYRSKYKILADLQKSHMDFTAHMANLELERIDKLLALKYGDQIDLNL